jgi:LacI family transcriptional regulator
LQVPGDLAVTGFDDTNIASHRTVQLTSVAQQKSEMGRLAVTYLLECIQDPVRFRRDPIRHILPPTLVVRRSCGAVAGSAPIGGTRVGTAGR